MTAYRKANIRHLVSEVYRLNGNVVEGTLHRRPEDGRWMVGGIPLNEWFQRHENEDISLMLVATETDRPAEVQVCHTCGREYTESSCPYCREVRYRLRGQ
ncbi:MAG: hypothetical protein JXB35_16665 [Anaerolineae bacterium]|nr:hypothetical protein [Anaerolineae bacterium]